MPVMYIHNEITSPVNRSVGRPEFVFTYTGIVDWLLISRTIQSTSLVSDSHSVDAMG